MRNGYKVKIIKFYDYESTERDYVGKDKDGADEYGYRITACTSQGEDNVYEQMVDELDVAKVISVVNSLDAS